MSKIIVRFLLGLSCVARGTDILELCTSEQSLKAELHHHFIESEIAKGNPWAMKKKFKGLMEGRYGYDEDPISAHQLLDSEISKGKTWALNKKLKGLADGLYGYEEDDTAARAFLESEVVKGNRWAIKKKREALVYGFYGYPIDIEQSRRVK